MKLTDLLLSQDTAYKEVLEVTGTLILDPNKSITITTNSNIIVTGKLVSRPILPAVHTIRFTGIDESKFLGGGEVVLLSDVGLWVTGAGQLDIQGEEKTAWTNVVGAIKLGDISFTVKEANNWRIGDEIVIARTSKTAIDDDVRKIADISGTKITVDKPLFDHPMVNNQWTAEVLNLTRNLRIEGTPGGMSHTFVMSMMMQNVMYCQFRYMGPRKNTVGDSAKEPVKGRYALHFHHCMEANAGMCAEGNVARDCNNHSFVTHMSHNMCWCDNIVYNALETGFWYDMGDATHGLEYEHNIVGKIGYVPGSRTLEDADTPSFGAGGFLLGMGDGNKCFDNVCFGIISAIGIDGAGAYQWRNNDESTWIKFKNNIAHNCSEALDIWQNTAMNHTLEGFIAYCCTSGGRLGAYANDYLYKDCTFFESPLLVKAGSLTNLRTRFEGLTIINGGPGYGDYAGVNAGIIQVGSPVDTIGDGQPPVLYRNCKLINCDFVLAGGEKAHWADFVDCEIKNLVVKGGERARVQQGGSSYVQSSTGKSSTTEFAPTNWGTGDGVLAEYFSDTNFKNKVAELIQPQMNFSELQNLGGPHHLITGSTYSIRCTGQLQAQWTDTHSFSMPADAGGASVLWINGKQTPGKIALIAGKKYDLKLEFQSTGSKVSGFTLIWNCPAMQLWSKGGETIPQSQLYSSGTTTPVNQAPRVNAGSDITIQLPISSTVLNGSGSDSDGVIVRYAWAKETGLGDFNIINAGSPVAQLTDLEEGEYSFGLMVTDDKGAVAVDYVKVTVLPAPLPPPNKPPIVTAAASVTVVRTGTIFLNGGATDPEGQPMTYQWAQIQGPGVIIPNSTSLITQVVNAPAGTYKFRLTVKDDKGAMSMVDVTITI